MAMWLLVEEEIIHRGLFCHDPSPGSSWPIRDHLLSRPSFCERDYLHFVAVETQAQKYLIFSAQLASQLSFDATSEALSQAQDM